MNWLSSNWIWLALGAGALALFAFGRGGSGKGHGGHNHGRQRAGDQNDPSRKATVSPFAMPAARLDSENTIAPSIGHEHGAPSEKEAALATEHAGHGNATGQAEPRRHRHGC